MPPQSNRNAAGPQQNLPGPVQRSLPQVNLQVTPAQVDGPNMNNAEMFAALGQALNIGVEAAGAISQGYKEEKRARNKAELAEFEALYARGELPLAGFDAFLVAAGDDPVMRKDVFGAMSRVDYDTLTGRPGANLGTRAFTMTNDERVELLKVLPGDPSKETLDERLVTYFESTAQEVPGYENLDDTGKMEMVAVGVRQFKTAIETDNDRRKAEQAESYRIGLVNANNASWEPYGLTTPGPAIWDYPRMAATSTELYGTKTDKALTESFGRAAKEFSNVDEFISLGNEFVSQFGFTEARVGAAVEEGIKQWATDKVDAFATSLGVALRSVEVTDTVEVIDLLIGEAGVDPASITSENVGDIVTDTVMNTLGLPEFVREETQNSLSSLNRQLKTMVQADEEFDDLVRKMHDGQDITPIDQNKMYIAGGSDLDSSIRGLMGSGSENVIREIKAFSTDIKKWKDLTDTANQGAMVPPALKGHILKLGRSQDPGDRLLGTILYQNLGGTSNPNLSFVDGETKTNFVFMASSIGTYNRDTGQYSGFRAEGGVIKDSTGKVVDADQVFGPIAFSANNTPPPSQAETDAFKDAFSDYTQKHFGLGGALFGLLGNKETDDFLMGGVNPDFAEGALRLSRKAARGDAKKQVKLYFGMIMSNGYTVVQESDGAPATMRWDPGSRLTVDEKKDLSAFAKNTAKGAMRNHFLDALRKRSNAFDVSAGYNAAIDSGDITVSLETGPGTSLDPRSDHAYFLLTTAGRNGAPVTSQVAIRWDELRNYGPAHIGESRMSRDARERQELLSDEMSKRPSYITPSPSSLQKPGQPMVGTYVNAAGARAKP